MFYSVISFFLGFLIDLWGVRNKGTREKDLELALLRQQLRIIARRQTRGPLIPRWQKLPLAVLANRLKGTLHVDALLFKPATLLRWHRELVRRKWTYKSQRKPGRPSIDADLESLIVRLAKENPRFGLGKLQGELKKLGFAVSRNAIKNVLKRNGLPPAPERSRESTSGQSFLSHCQCQILARDVFTVETAWLQTIYVLFFILKTRPVHFAGCTTKPDLSWVTQQARQMAWGEDRELSMKYLIHDRDAKFTASFDTVFASEGMEVVLTPFRAPTANAFA